MPGSNQYALHIVPVGGDEPIHWAAGGQTCWCYPLQTYNEELQSWQVTHNAQDCREAMERQGFLDPTRPWVPVAGTVEVVDQTALLPVE